MKILNSKKKVITALALSALALSGCSKVNTVEYNGKIYNIEDNRLLKDYDDSLSLTDRLTYKPSGLSMYILPGQYNNQLSVVYDNSDIASDDVYEYINSAISETNEFDTLSIHISKGNLDFSKIDVSKYRRIMFDVANVEFDYTPFYNNTYEFLSINISGKTNIDSIVDFLDNINTENASIDITFENDTSVEDTQKIIDVLAKIKSVDSIELSSTSINELNIVDLACDTLTLHNPTTDKKINYDFTINDTVKTLYVESSFAENYNEDAYLESFKVNSNNEDLWTHYEIYRFADIGEFNIKANNQTVIEVPNNTELDIIGLDISEVDNDWLKKFSNLEEISIRPYPAYSYSFLFDSSRITMDEAIEEKEYKEAKENIGTELKKMDISYTAQNGYISIDADYDSPNKNVPEEFYTIINREFEDPDKDYLMIDRLNNQVDFTKIDLTNITTISFERIGEDFDFTPFYNQNISNIKLKIQENANHENILEFLRNIRDINMRVSIYFQEIEKNQNTEVIQQYVDVLSTRKNLKEVTIDAQMASCVNYDNLVTDNLSLYINSNQDELNYDISINDQIQNLTILTSFDEEYSKKPYIGDIKVNSNNNSLITDLYFNSYDFDKNINSVLDKDTANINLPEGSGLRIVGVDFDSIDYEAIEALDYLRYIYIGEEGNEDYAFCYHFQKNTFEEALEKFQNQNKDRKGQTRTIN